MQGRIIFLLEEPSMRRPSSRSLLVFVAGTRHVAKAMGYQASSA